MEFKILCFNCQTLLYENSNGKADRDAEVNTESFDQIEYTSWQECHAKP